MGWRLSGLESSSSGGERRGGWGEEKVTCFLRTILTRLSLVKGCLAGHSPYSQAAKEICEASLKKYAEAVYKANEKNFTGEKLSRKGWFFGLF